MARKPKATPVATPVVPVAVAVPTADAVVTPAHNMPPKLAAYLANVTAERVTDASIKASTAQKSAALRVTLLSFGDAAVESPSIGGAYFVKSYYETAPKGDTLRSRTADGQIMADAARANITLYRGIWPTAEEIEADENLSKVDRRKFLIGCGEIKRAPQSSLEQVRAVIAAKSKGSAEYKVPDLKAATAGDVLELIQLCNRALFDKSAVLYNDYSQPLGAFQTTYIARKAAGDATHMTTKEAKAAALAASQVVPAPAPAE